MSHADQLEALVLEKRYERPGFDRPFLWRCADRYSFLAVSLTGCALWFHLEGAIPEPGTNIIGYMA